MTSYHVYMPNQAAYQVLAHVFKIARVANTDLHRDDAAGLVVVRPAGAVAVQGVQQRIGLITKGMVSHRTKVKVEAVHQEVNFDPGPPGLGTHGWGWT